MRKLLIAVAVVLGICVAGTVLANLGDDDGQFAAHTKAPMRKVYPNGVPAGHPAYRSSMDRDHDGRACER